MGQRIDNRALDRVAARVAAKLGCTVLSRKFVRLPGEYRIEWRLSDRQYRVGASLVLKAENGYNPQGTWWKGAVTLWSAKNGATSCEIERGKELVPSWGSLSGTITWGKTKVGFVRWADEVIAGPREPEVLKWMLYYDRQETLSIKAGDEVLRKMGIADTHVQRVTGVQWVAENYGGEKA